MGVEDTWAVEMYAMLDRPEPSASLFKASALWVAGVLDKLRRVMRLIVKLFR